MVGLSKGFWPSPVCITLGVSSVVVCGGEVWNTNEGNIVVT